MPNEAAAPQIWIGTSGWVYPHWAGIFYPATLRQSQWLAFYSSYFPTVEINRSFYRLPPRHVFEGWRLQTPKNFLFAVKASRYITHMRKLGDPVGPLTTFHSAIEGLGEKCGPILFQLPPFWKADRQRLSEFLRHLQPGRHYAFEFRHPSWLEDEVLEHLKAHQVALAIPDFPGMPRRMALTAPFTYIRFHGGEHGPGYTVEELQLWAERIAAWAQGVEIYVYFNNDYAGWAIRNAATLWRILEDMGLSQKLASLKTIQGED